MPGFELQNVRPWTGSGKIRAFCNVRLGDLTIHDVRLIDGDRGPFVAGPATKDQHGRWRAFVSFEPGLEAELLAAFEAALADGQR